MIAQPTSEVNSHRPAWRPTKPQPEPIIAAVHGPTERADYVAAIEWCFTATADEILERHYHKRDDSPGWRLGVAICKSLLFVLAEQQTDIDWLAQCRRWRDRLGNAVVAGIMPPTPWERDRGGVSELYHSQSRSTAAILLRGSR